MQALAPKRIWIDTDCVVGAKTVWPGDPDDGYALAAVIRAAQQEPELFKILGISVAEGNADAPTVQDCIRRLVATFHATDLKIFTHIGAARAITDTAGEFSLLALGPLTNPARALALRRDLAERVTLLTVGTVLNPRNWRRRMSDFNMRYDQAATRCLSQFRSRFIFPLDVLEQLTLDRGRISQVESTGPQGAYLAHHSMRWLRWSLLKHGRFRFPPWDLIAALAVVDRLANPAWDSENRLTHFDADKTWSNFLQLLRSPYAGK